MIWVEIRRAFARDVTLFIGLVFIGVVILASIGVFVSHPTQTPEQNAQFDRRREGFKATRSRFVDSCVSGSAAGTIRPSGGQPPQGLSRRQCERMVTDGRDPNDQRFYYSSLLQTIQGLAFPIGIAALGLGASLIGAEWGAGTIGTLLTWEPRRWRVFFSKALGVAVAVFALTTFIEFSFALGLLPAAAVKGSMAGIDAQWWKSLGLSALRVNGATVTISLIGFSIANLMRNTTAAAGATAAYLAILDPILSGTVDSLRPWLVVSNLSQFVSWGAAPTLGARPPDEAGLLLGAYVVGALAISFVLFQRRDVA